jgi:hypothetical protein
MVDIHSIAASSNPSRREQETEREVTSRSWAGRSRRAGGRSGAMTAATATQHQRTTGTARLPPPVTGVEATLVVGRQLLNNLMLAHTSPSAAEQWSHNVDQLVVMAINTPHNEVRQQEPTIAHSRSPSAARTPPSARVPHQTCVLPSIATADLGDELIRCRRGRIVASPSRATVKGAAISRAATSSEILTLLCQHERRLRRVLCVPLALQEALEGVWHLHHISGWWSGHVSSGLIYRRSTTGWLTPPNSSRSTPPPSSL